MSIAYYDSPVGLLLIEERYGKIVRITNEDYKVHNDESNEVLDEAIKQLDEYFNGKRFEFDLPIEVNGTPYMLKVWNELLKIPYGETVSYQELARRVGNEKGARSAGGACGKNNIIIVIPCHRVIGKNGKLTGYTGGLNIKAKLLDLEYKYISE